MEQDKAFPGMPLYVDQFDRKLPDPTAPNDTDWYPATPPTKKLWRCFESLQKISFCLLRFDLTTSPGQTRRFIVNFVVPLSDLFTCVLDLSRSIEGDPQTRNRLTDRQLQTLRMHRGKFEEFVVRRSAPIKTIRDKLGAHTDRGLEPGFAAKLFENITIHEVGAYLHASLLYLRDMTRLDCYSWSSKGYREDETRLMTCEPYVVNFKTEEMGALVGIEKTESPKRHVFELMADIVEVSTWMFEDDQSRLVVNERPEY